VVCLAPRAPGESVRPRRLSGVVMRPLNFTVRRMVSTVVTRLARGATLTSCCVLVVCVALAALDIWLATPGVWHLIPRPAEPVLLWAPLAVALAALSLTAAAALRREPSALSLRNWFGAATIALFYAFVAIWNHFFPMVVY
jgi:hypothetical protein